MTTPFPGAILAAVLRQSDGKLVVVGASSNDFLVTRYNDDGSVDTTFGTTGVTMTPVGSADSAAFGAVLQPDGRIVAAGEAKSAGGDNDFALVRYDDDGTLDATFGSGGVVVTSIGSFDDAAADVVYQPDGALVVSGYHGIAAAGAREFALARYDNLGVLDPTFGSAGVVTTAFSGGIAQAGPLALQGDGKLVAAGTLSIGGVQFQICLARYEANGSLDASFGAGGKLVNQFDDQSFTGDLALQSDGRAVLVGFTAHQQGPTVVTNVRMAVARYLPNCGDGVLDPGEQCDAAACCTFSCEFAASGTPCDAGDTACSTGDTCDGVGTCTPGPPPQCGPCEVYDSNNCCVAAPRPLCKLPVQAGGSLMLQDASTGDKLTWKWTKGAATTVSDFGAVLTTDDLTLCVFDATPYVLVTAVTPAGGICGTKPCWKATSSGYAYRSKFGTPNGIVTEKLKAGPDGKARIAVTAKGPSLTVPALTGLALPLRVQLSSDDGSCWEADYSAAGVRRNDGAVFKGKAD